MKTCKQKRPMIRGSGWMLMLLLAFSLGLTLQAEAKTYTFNGPGSWTNPNNWVDPPGAPDPIDQINPFDTVIISGVCDIPAGWTITIYGTVLNQGMLKNHGTLEIEAGGVVSNEPTGMITNLGKLHTKPPFGLLPGGTISNQGTLSNTGEIDNEGNLVNAGGLGNGMTGVINNSGTLYNASSPHQGSIMNGGTLNNAGTVQNFGSLTNSGLVMNGGTLENGSGSSMSNCSNATIVNNGSMLNNEGAFSQQGILMGNGSLSGASVINQGTVTAGESPGILTFHASLTNTSNAKAFFEIGGETRNEETEFDQLVVNGTAYLNGTLEVVLINNFQPQIGQSFTLIFYEDHQGTFDTELLPDLTPGTEWQVAYTDEGLVLSVVYASSVQEVVAWPLTVGEPCPNPVVGNMVSLPINLETPGEIRIDLLTPDGRVVEQYKWQLPAGAQMLTLSLDQMTPGACLIRIQWNGQPVAYRKVVWAR